MEQEVIRSMKTPVNFPIVLQGQPLYSLSMCLPYEAKYIKISQQGTDAWTDQADCSTEHHRVKP